MYASRTLTTTEKKYAQLEMEALAVSYAVKRFHQYIYGTTFTLLTDNRALARILSPDRDMPGLAAARMQRYALQLAAHSYTVECRGGQKRWGLRTTSLACRCRARTRSVERRNQWRSRQACSRSKPGV